jgi:2-(1,2-epoxy-1,2-dihydrophenyl)acetyl-CoA isomerase
LVLARPDRANRLDRQALPELSEVADLATGQAHDGELRCLLVEQRGKFFSTGGDLESLGASREGAAPFVRSATTPLNSAVSRLARLGAPIVVAVGGPAIGAGVAFAALADVVIASERAAFVAGYPAIGMTPDAGLSWFLPRRVGSRHATDYFLRNRTWSAAEARDRGLVTELVAHDELAARAGVVATELAAGPTAAYAATRGLLLSAQDLSLESQLELEAQTLAGMAGTEDGWHGITSMLTGSRPTFRGR